MTCLTFYESLPELKKKKLQPRTTELLLYQSKNKAVSLQHMRHFYIKANSQRHTMYKSCCLLNERSLAALCSSVLQSRKFPAGLKYIFCQEYRAQFEK